MRKTTSVLLAVLLCLSMIPSWAFADAESGDAAAAALPEVTAVSAAFQRKFFQELNESGKLALPEEMSGVKISDNTKAGGILLNGKAQDLTAGRITLADEYDFSEQPENRSTGVKPAGRITVDGLSDKKAKVTVSVYLDDEEEPRASMLLRKQMGKTGWSREGDITADVLSQGITGKHRVSVALSIDGVGPEKKTNVLLRSLTFCESSIPVMYFNIDESEASIDAMNSSDDHSSECYGTVTLEVPGGYKGEFSDKELKTQENMELEYVRGRGNSTWGMDKKPYKVKFDKKHDLLGMGKNKHWVLLANRYDNSLMRNRITYWIVRHMGIEFAIKCAPVEVVMNGRYLGSYLLSEQVRVGENRISIDELDEKVSDPDSKEITGGYLLNLSGYGDDEISTFASERDGYYEIESPDFGDYPDTDQAQAAMSAQHNYIADYVTKTGDAIFGEGMKDSYGRSYTEFLDEQSAADYWWIQEFSINGDAFGGGSNYLYKKRVGDPSDPSGKLYWGPLWDFDYVAWGNPNSDAETIEGFSNTSNGWMNRLRTDEEFKARLRARWSSAIDDMDDEHSFDQHLGDLVTEVIKDGGVLDQYYDEVRVSQQYDWYKWGFYNEGGWSDEYGYEEQEQKAPQTFESEREQLRNWIAARQAWVDENISDVGVRTYTVKFFIGKKVIESRTVQENESLGNLPEAPEKPGYTFTGWYDEYGSAADEDNMVGWDQDLTGKYVKTSSLKKAETICFDRYEVYTWFSRYDEGENSFYPEYKFLPENSAPATITWSVDDPETATVGENGTVTAKKAGTVKVTATLPSGKKNSYTISFVEDGELNEVEELRLNKKKVSLKAGGYTQLRAEFFPKPTYVSSAEWFTTDPDIISVDDFGIVTAKKPGTATVIAFESDNRHFAVCKVKVTATTSYRIKTAKAANVNSVKAKRSGKAVKVSWKKVSGVSGYYVLRASKKNGKFRKAETIKKAAAVRWTDRKARGKKCYYKVQPFTKIGGKVYKGNASKAVSAR